MHVYARRHIDFWPGWMTEDQYRASLRETYSDERDADRAFREYESLRDSGYAEARKIGWEGEIREGPFIAGLPSPGDDASSLIMIAWKQPSKGDTFIVSPIELPWLGRS